MKLLHGTKEWDSSSTHWFQISSFKKFASFRLADGTTLTSFFQSESHLNTTLEIMKALQLERDQFLAAGIVLSNFEVLLGSFTCDSWFGFSQPSTEAEREKILAEVKTAVDALLKG